MEKDKTIEMIRSFNRFYPANMGFLDDTAVYTGYSLAESRVLFEIQLNPNCIQNDLVKNLNLDKSYLSRILDKLNKKELIKKTSSIVDKRAFTLSLTEKGKQEYERLVQISNEVLQEKIKELNDEECVQLCSSLQTVMDILGK